MKKWLCSLICFSCVLGSYAEGEKNTMYNGVVRELGRPRMWINGKGSFEYFFLSDAVSYNLDMLSETKKAEFPCVGIPISPTGKGEHFKPVWTWNGKHEYDWQPLDIRLAEMNEKAPGASFFLAASVDPPSSWVEAHRDELIKYEADGLPMNPAFATSEVKGSIGPSYASKVYRQVTEDYLRALVKHLMDGPYRNQISGLFLTGGLDGQFYWRGWRNNDPQYSGDYGDYSEVMRAYFIQFLQEKYHYDLAELRKAWNKPDITFADVAIPASSRRIGEDEFRFRDPATEQDVIDFTEAYCRAPVDFIKGLARTIKESAGEDKLWVGVYSGGGWDTGQQTRGRTLQASIYECKDIDLIATPTYASRPLNQPGAYPLEFGSLRIHNKIGIVEQDIRTYLAKIKSDRENVLYGFTPDWERQRSMFVREFGRVLTAGLGTWLYDMYGHWYNAPEFWELFQQFQKIGKEEIKKEFSSVSEMAVIIDDESQLYLPKEDGFLQLHSVGSQSVALGWMGAPHDSYYFKDLFNEKTPLYKTYVFLNVYKVDSAEREALHNLLSKAKATAVWVYAAGIVSDNMLSVDNVKLLTGFTVRPIRTEDPQYVVLRNVNHPITTGIEGSSYGNPPLFDPLPWGKLPPYLQRGHYRDFYGKLYYCIEPDNELVALGDMSSATGIGLATKNMPGGWKSIYSSGLEFNADVLRNILRFSGAFIYSDDSTVGICASKQHLSVYSKTAGIKKIRLPAVACLKDLFSGEELGPEREFSIEFKEFEAKVFEIK